VAQQLGDRREQRVVAADVGVAIGRHDEQPGVTEGAGEELEEQ
jgi:hypothetical protein